jgi:hypothetical protein
MTMLSSIARLVSLSLFLAAATTGFFYVARHKWLLNIGEFDANADSFTKEAILYSEEAFYYSFYKDVVQAPSIGVALAHLVQNDDTEAPDTINVLQVNPALTCSNQ